ncbi:unnamed protein product [Pieris macdunnoughi]|nr:unnamed protein product [Pieris macdunnoughi]
MKDPHGKLARWAMKLQAFSFDIVHRPGSSNVVPDALSRSINAIEIQADGVEIREEHKNTWYKDKVKSVLNSDSDINWRVRDGLLYKKICLKQYPDKSNDWKLYIPEILRSTILKRCHNDVKAGHLGIRKTVFRVKQYYYWPNILGDVKRHVGQCEICAKFKVSQRLPFGYMGHQRHVNRPWQIISLDLMGPFPRSKSGNTMLLVITCFFSKFVLLFPLRTGKADKICSIVESQFLLFGVPQAIISDNERVDRVIGTMISSFINTKKHNEWDLYLQSFAYAVRTSVHETTGYTPSFLFFGRETAIPPKVTSISYDAVNMFDKPLSIDAKEFLVSNKKLFSVYEKVEQKMKDAHKKSTSYYNLKRREAKLNVGDTVWKMNKFLSNAGKIFMAKLAPKFDKAIIVERLSSNVFRLNNWYGKPLGVWHAKDLKPYLGECNRMRVETKTTDTDGDCRRLDVFEI